MRPRSTSAGRSPRVLSWASLFGLIAVASHGSATHLSIVALHPHDDQDCEALRTVVQDGRLGRVYVQIWARNDMVRHWVEGLGAVDLHAGGAAEADPLRVAACELMVNEEYNGLSTGNGKATVIQLLRAFKSEGYAPDTDEWLRAYFAAGGSFRQAAVVKRLVGEVQDGRQHRVPQRYGSEIVSILRERVVQWDASPSS